MSLTDTIASFIPEAVILDAGQYPIHPIPLGILAGSAKVVCCDSTARQFTEHGRTPWRIIGDLDSLNADLRQRFEPIIRHNPDQETNDQTKAVEYLKAHGLTHIAIIGATGLREDHTLGNISLLVDYMRQGIDARIYTDHGVFIPCCDTFSFYCPVGSQVSVFNFGARQINATGLRYPLRDFDNWWQGTLNQTTESTVTIRAQGSYLLFINYPSSCTSGQFNTRKSQNSIS